MGGVCRICAAEHLRRFVMTTDPRGQQRDVVEQIPRRTVLQRVRPSLERGFACRLEIALHQECAAQVLQGNMHSRPSDKRSLFRNDRAPKSDRLLDIAGHSRSVGQTIARKRGGHVGSGLLGECELKASGAAEPHRITLVDAHHRGIDGESPAQPGRCNSAMQAGFAERAHRPLIRFRRIRSGKGPLNPHERATGQTPYLRLDGVARYPQASRAIRAAAATWLLQMLFGNAAE
jgi:hypothetical protein